MHPTDVDPGVTLAGRYRVAELLAETPGDGGVAQTWRAVDEVLSRSVVVYVLAADDPRADALLEASRRAATATDVRFLRVLDALRDDGVAYVVREWVAGRSLATVLADGPLPPHQAGLLVREVAEALANAHDQGLAHERLDPDSVLITDSGAVKIVGLATQAALDASGGTSQTDPARADAIGLGRLLYAALTARWPTGPLCGLDAAPRAADGSLLLPRQVRAGVPRPLDEITERILLDQPRSGDPLTAPREIAMALTEVVGSTPLEGVLPPPADPSLDPTIAAPPVAPRPPSYADQPTQVGGRPVDVGGPNGAGRWNSDQVSDYPAAQPTVPVRSYPPPRPPAARPYPPARRRGPRWSHIAGVLVGLVLLCGVGLFAWQLMSQAFRPPQSTPSSSASAEPSATRDAAEPGTPIEIAAARDYDPSPGSDGEEHPEDVDKAYDGDPSTVWTTMSYRGDPRLGRLKPGVGIWFDLGSVQSVGSVELQLLGNGTDLEIRVAPDDAVGPPATADEWRTVESVTGAGSEVTIEFDKPVRTRYLLVWMTKLPPEGSEYRGGVAEIVVRQ
ncbi:protein kinase family protein [Thermasporomyces composti]|uniref:non-specific serine/threonine protein kinase n=1 Tax=Thermasporomyces composti TaxID=696763 RepID=A0A3D9VGN1_THECX|nr:protein kinase family protein [Thermasporomyces composti]REF36471.1 protein kinase-like protein [Thermasporomyces composti]